MSEFKGTKGKWRTFNSRIEQWGQHHHTVICRFESNMSQESAYNAQLISKAPELLEMLVRLHDTLGTAFHREKAEIRELIKEATEI